VTGPLRRALPLLAFVAVLLCAWLQPSPAALADIAGRAWATDAPVVDTTGGIDRTAVKPQPPAQPQAIAKKRLDPSAGPSPAPIAAMVGVIVAANREARRDSGTIGRTIVLIPARTATVAQPRAPPIQQDLTPAA
jgi:hypothetical protein